MLFYLQHDRHYVALLVAELHNFLLVIKTKLCTYGTNKPTAGV